MSKIIKKSEKIEKLKTEKNKTYLLASLIFWTLAMAGSAVYQIESIKKSSLDDIVHFAKSHFEKDVLFRKWAARHGGVYAPVSDFTKPNPYLKVPNRDIITPEGKTLTLVNPAYMTRQVHEMMLESGDIRSHITSLRLFNPANKPDEWEEAALKKFKNGVKVVYDIMQYNGKEHLRYMQPLVVEQACMNCHEIQGYKLGEIRGGISVSTPTEEFFSVRDKNIANAAVAHTLVWALGVGFIFFVFDRLRLAEKRRIEIMENLELSRENEERQRKNAEAATSLKDKFIANFSHEIRTPINAIQGFAEILKGKIFDRKQTEYLNSIIFSSNSLLKLVNDILDVSKIDAGNFEVKPVPVSLEQFLLDIYKIFKLETRRKDLNLYLEVDEVRNIFVEIDEARLRQIIFNIVANSVKYTNKGFVKIGAYESSKTAADGLTTLTITVQDSGSGIPEEELENVFQPFYRSSAHSKLDGAGLGLTITKRLVEKMGGSISIVSRENQGALVKVAFKNLKKTVKTSSAESDINYRLALDDKSILIVDENEVSRKLTAEFFEYSGCNIYESDNGFQAIELARSYKPDLIIIDLNASRLDGIKTAAAIKSDSNTAKTPIIGISTSREALSSETLDSVNDYLVKPISKKELFDLVGKYFGETGSTDEIIDAKPKTKYDSIGSGDRKAAINTLKAIEKDFKEKYESIKRSPILSDMTNFALALRDLGYEHGCAVLIEYAKDLYEQTVVFDFEKLTRTFDLFPTIVAIIRKRANPIKKKK